MIVNLKLKFLSVTLIISPIVFSIKNNEDFKQTEKYGGDKFPVKYLSVDYKGFSIYDLNNYINALDRTVNYFSKFPNDTDVNTAFGTYFTMAVLKSTLKDYGDVFSKNQTKSIKYVLGECEYILSHYIYMNKPYGWDDLEHRVSKIFHYDEPFVYSIEKFNRNQLTKWLYKPSDLNKFLEQMDDATLPKETYARCVERMHDYYSPLQSDRCLSHIVYNPEVIDVTKLIKCKDDEICMKEIERVPSVAYALSHRLLLLMISKYIRRCYIFSKEKDNDLTDMMCAQMYREAVYTARRGYFSRDMWLEHIALCSAMGYEEFFRRPWFLKAASWVDNMGCVCEFRNFDINRTRVILDEAKTPQTREVAHYRAQFYLNNKCRLHTMALVIVVLAQAIRHSAHLIKKKKNRH